MKLLVLSILLLLLLFNFHSYHYYFYNKLFYYHGYNLLQKRTHEGPLISVWNFVA